MSGGLTGAGGASLLVRAARRATSRKWRGTFVVRHLPDFSTIRMDPWMTRRTSRSLGWTGWTAARRFPRPARARLSALASLWEDDEHQSTHGRRPPGSRVHGLQGGEEEEPDLGKARQGRTRKRTRRARLLRSPCRHGVCWSSGWNAGSTPVPAAAEGPPREGGLAWFKGEVKQKEEEVQAEEEEEEGEAGPPPPPTRWGMGRGRCRCGGTSGQR